MKRLIQNIFWFITLLYFAVACSKDEPTQISTGYITSLSASSDGQHVISASDNKQITLWNLNKRTSKVISNNGNLFSAYFIKATNKFIWQDLDNIVHITSVNGSESKSWHHFPTYGHIISTKQDGYYSADADWNIYFGYGDKLTPVKKDGASPSFLGSGKLINLNLSHDDSRLLTAGVGYEFDSKYPVDYRMPVINDSDYSKLAGVVLWNTESKKPIEKITGNLVKTFATFSPDGKYVVSGDENYHKFVWDLANNKRVHWLADLGSGRIINREEHYEKWTYDNTGLIPTPKNMGSDAILSIKFISSEYFLTFFYSNHYVALYHIDNDMPLKYFDLGEKPYPSVKEYYRNVSIDTAPEAGVLVTGQHRGGGINVYQFDADKLTLERIWVTQ